MAVLVAWRAIQLASPISKKSGVLGIGAIVCVLPLLVPTLWAGGLVSHTLETIPAHNPVHWSHLRLPLLLFLVGGAATAVMLWRAKFVTTSASVMLACVLGILERSHGWWHASVLLGPGLILAAENRLQSTASKQTLGWKVLLAWTWLSAALSYRHISSAFWHWLGSVAFGLK